LLISFFSCSFLWTQKKDIYEDALKRRLSFIFRDEALKKTTVGLVVKSLSQDRILYSKNPNKLLSPASAVKVLTGAVALKVLGANYKFKTRIYTNGRRSGSTLNGDIYLVGGADPALVTEQLFLLINKFSRTGIKKITGNIYVDDSIFDDEYFDENRIKTNSDRPYNAPVSGLSFNYNTVTVYFRPGAKAGSPARIIPEHRISYFKYNNKLKTQKTKKRSQLIASRTPYKSGDVIGARGFLKVGQGEERAYFNITKPSLYTGHILKKYMKDYFDVEFSSKAQILVKKRPSTARVQATIESLPLSEIVRRMNKFSNNFVADTLVKYLGYKRNKKQGTMKEGLEVLAQEALAMGVNTSGFKVVSGSGLTRFNRMSAQQFMNLLDYVYKDMTLMPEVLSSLAIAGVDGTMRSRMKSTQAKGNLRAKTGSINGVSTLVGYVQGKRGELLAFSVMMNDHGKTSSLMRKWQNFFGQALAEFQRKAQ